MKLRPFELNLGEIDVHAIAQASFYALVAAGWVLYSSGLVAASAAGRDLKAMSEAELVSHAQKAFAYVIQWMPVDHPYRREMERYMRDALPTAPELRVSQIDPPWPF
jgi:hypothetical protein